MDRIVVAQAPPAPPRPSVAALPPSAAAPSPTASHTIALTDAQKDANARFLDPYFGAGSTEAFVILVFTLLLLWVWGNIATFLSGLGTGGLMTESRSAFFEESKRHSGLVTRDAQSVAEEKFLGDRIINLGGVPCSQDSTISSPSSAGGSPSASSVPPLAAPSSSALSSPSSASATISPSLPRPGFATTSAAPSGSPSSPTASSPSLPRGMDASRHSESSLLPSLPPVAVQVPSVPSVPPLPFQLPRWLRLPG